MQQNTINYQTICLKVLKSLPQKQKEVLERRFGLLSGNKETLQIIGKDFGITRERVRQIESEAFDNLLQKNETKGLSNVFAHFKEYFKEQGGLKREDILLANLGGNRFQNQIYFLLTWAEPFYRFSESESFYPFWSIDKDIAAKVKKIIESILLKFKKEKKPLSAKDILSLAQEQDSRVFLSSIETAKQIEKGPLGNFGLVAWSEIKPRGVRDRAYLSLKKAGRPLHFRKIAELSSFLNGGLVEQKKVLPQTVHNELIRDERFVLVGRGIYALREWGYISGTVKDVICDILGRAKKPLATEEIVRSVLEQRVVKPNTILLNLNNERCFSRDDKGNYILRT